MVEKESDQKEKSVLLMLSGGRDSFLSACRLIEEGYYVSMITYDNGHMAHAENAQGVAERIVSWFGGERAEFVGIHTIAQNIRPLLEKALYAESLALTKEYPHLLFYQLNCLACHTVMYFHSIAYCKAHGIGAVAEGAREEQRFFVELPEMMRSYDELCREYELELLTPVYEMASDIKRKEELSEWGFLPKSYEPQCWLGCPMKEELSKEQKNDLSQYYDREIKPKAKDMIQMLVRKKMFWNVQESVKCRYV